MRGRFKNEIGKGQKRRQQKGGLPSGSAPQAPPPLSLAIHCQWFLVSARSSQIPFSRGRAGRHVCVHTYTHRHTLQADKVASGLALWRRQGSAIGPREHRNPGCPALSPWAMCWVSASGPHFVQSLPWTPRIPTEHPLGVLSPCFPALQRGWPPPLPSSPASFLAQSYRAGADPACCWPVWGAHTSQRHGGPWPCAPDTLGHAPRPQPPP